MNFSDHIKAHVAVWPKKITSVMETHRQRFSQVNQKFKQRPIVHLPQPPPIYPVVLPQPSRPQPRQQARSKQQIPTHFPPTRRSNSAQMRNLPSAAPGEHYITLANLAKIFHVLQAREKLLLEKRLKKN